jgi:hypothetical protein
MTPATDWTKNLTNEKEKVEFEAMLMNSSILTRLKELVDQKYLELDAQETTKDAYDTPSWAYKQADKNGYRRSLKYFDQLLQHLET